MTVGAGPIATEERPVSRGEASSRRRSGPTTAVLRASRWFEPALLATTVALLVAGGVAWVAGSSGWADALWAAATVAAVVPAAGWVVTALVRRTLGVDLIAVLALLGTLAVGEYLAGALIAVMLATGRALDAAAQRRATRDLRALLERAPRTARRRVGDVVSEVAVDEVAVGDLVVVGPGEVLPVDGLVEASPAVLDESALTGEPELVERAVGEPVRSGTLNAGGAIEVRCSVPAAQSTYAGIIALVRQAGAESAPVIRLADRFAAWFLPLSLALAGLAWWASGSAERAVAVLVVATPCPLLLAAPVAIVSGLSRASRRGVVVRSGGALENLGRAQTMVLDKTGTLTAGRPAVTEVAAAPGRTAAGVLRMAASADQLSPHVLAEAVVAEARRRGLALSLPDEVEEEPGRGVTAAVDGVRVRVGKRDAVPDAVGARGGQPGRAGRLCACVGRGRRRPGRRRPAQGPAAGRREPHPAAAAHRRHPAPRDAHRGPARTGPGGREGPGARRGARASRRPRARSKAYAPRGSSRSP